MPEASLSSPEGAAAGAKPAAPELSVVVPLYNEEANVPELYRRLKEALDQLGRAYEIIFVNDGSRDQTGRHIERLADQDAAVVAVNFRRNFGQTAALAAGIDLSRGKIILPMDGDLQNDPADIQRLLARLDEGYDVVSGWRKQRRDSLLRVIPSRLANALISRISGVRLHDYGCTLKAYRREVLQGVNLYGEMHRFIPIYAVWQGARVTEMPVTHHARRFGKSHYGLERMLKVLLDLVVVKFFSAYLTKPIYVFGGFGCLSIILSFLSLAAALVFKLIPRDNPWGEHWHKDLIQTPLPVLAVGFFAVGVMMTLIGLLAEMLMRTYYESQHKPVYLIGSIKRRAPGT